MIIYWIRAQAPRRVLALAKHLGAAAEFVELDLMGGGLRKAAYAALNPNMKAPTLVDGDLVLWESSAIMTHLCIKAGSDMWPADNPAEQVEMLRWLSWNDCHWSNAVAPFYFEHVVKPTFGIGAPDIESLKSKVADFVKFAKVARPPFSGTESRGVRKAYRRRFPTGIDGILLASIGDAIGSFSEHRALD
jgi:glutathione S-transferase